jgi:WD40 repeat protein
VEVWDAGSNRHVVTLGVHAEIVRGLAFSRDGKYLASADDGGTVKLWDGNRLRDQQEEIHTFRAWVPHVGFVMAFSPDGRRLAAGGEKRTVKIWDVQTGKELQSLEGHSGDVCAVAFSPDPEGRWVASAGEDSTVKIWDSLAGTFVRNFRGHTSLVTSVAFTPDGRHLVSGSRDGSVKVWDVSQIVMQRGKGAITTQ